MNQAATQARRTGDEPWMIVVVLISAFMLFVMVFFTVWTHQVGQPRYVTDDQGKRLAGVVLAQAIMLREDRKAIIALARMQRANGESIQALIGSQLYQNRSIRTLAYRRGILVTK